jgi:hypothetical protein
MPVPAGYSYKDGGYWRLSDGTGPYGFDVGSSTPVLLSQLSTPTVTPAFSYKDGAWWNEAGEGPFPKAS